MLIAKTQKESDMFCDQELSHILVLEKSPQIRCKYPINFEKQCFFELPERESFRRLKTKKYGTLAMFDRISDMLDSKFNKGVLPVYCESSLSISRKKTTNRIVKLSSISQTYEFEDKEFSNSGGIYLNEVKNIDAQNAYLVVVERNKFSNNGVQLIDNFKLKS